MIITTSAAATFEKCEYRYYLRYRRGLVSKGTNPKMMIGTFFHDGLASLFRGKTLKQALASLPKPATLPNEHIEPMFIARFLLERYHSYWSERPPQYKSVETVERVYRIKLARGIWLCGKLDAEVRGLDDRLWLYEHKSTADLTTSYLNKIVLDGQITTYLYLMWKTRGELPAGAVYNVICRPTTHRRVNEAIFPYLKRAEEKYLATPEKYLAQQQAFRSVDLIESFEHEMKRLGRQIQGCARAGIWRKAVCNSSMACFPRGAQCPYTAICEAGETADVLRGFDYKKPHSELEEDE